MLDNREIAITIWFALFLAWGFLSAPVRKAAASVIKAALARKIVFSVCMMTAYITLTVLALRACGLWGISNLKATVLWVLTAALVMVFDVGSIPDDERYFQKAFRDGFKVSVILEFIVNLHVFSLTLEFVLVPVATILTGMLVVAESKEEFKPVRSLLNVILALLGLGLLAYSAHEIYTDFNVFVQPSTLAEFLLPIVMTTLFLPFLYLLATGVSYENLFKRLQFIVQDPELRRFAKAQLFRQFGINFRGLNRSAKHLVHDRPSTREEILASIGRAGAAG